MSDNLASALLNAAQLNTVLALDDMEYGRVITLGHGIHQPLVQVTSEIVELHVQVGSPNNFSNRRAAVLWLNKDGRQIASAVKISMQRDDDTVETYWLTPEMLSNSSGEPITKQHKAGMWSLVESNGAVAQTRKFITDNYGA